MDRENINCKGTNRRGEPCKAAATHTGYCYLHSDPSRAAQLGREGGRRNRHFIDDSARPLPSLDSIAGIRQAISLILEDLYAGRVHPRKAAAMAPLLGPLLRAATMTDVEERLRRLETQLAEVSEDRQSAAAKEEGGTLAKRPASQTQAQGVEVS